MIETLKSLLKENSEIDIKIATVTYTWIYRFITHQSWQQWPIPINFVTRYPPYYFNDIPLENDEEDICIVINVSQIKAFVNTISSAFYQHTHCIWCCKNNKQLAYSHPLSWSHLLSWFQKDVMSA
jgi:hypothetical protein